MAKEKRGGPIDPLTHFLEVYECLFYLKATDNGKAFKDVNKKEL